MWYKAAVARACNGADTSDIEVTSIFIDLVYSAMLIASRARLTNPVNFVSTRCQNSCVQRSLEVDLASMPGDFGMVLSQP